MPRLMHITAVALTALALLPDVRGANNGAHRDPAKVPGSKVRQLLLKQALEKHAPTLLAELNHNKKVWDSLAPEQLRSLRERYYAFLKQDPDKQLALMEAAEKFHRLSQQQREAYLKRAAWLKRVVARLTPAQREALRKLTPAERAKRLLELKAQLPDTQPATMPASRPASTTTKHE